MVVVTDLVIVLQVLLQRVIQTLEAALAAKVLVLLKQYRYLAVAELLFWLILIHFLQLLA